MKRKHTVFLSYGLVILCAILPIIFSYYAATFYAEHVAKKQLALFVSSQDHEIQQFLAKLDARLDTLSQQEGRCNERTVLQLQQLVYDMHQVSFVALATPEGQVTCTQYGPINVPYPLKPHTLSKPLHLVGVTYVRKLQRESFIIEKQAPNKSIIFVGINTTNLKHRYENFMGSGSFVALYSKSHNKFISLVPTQDPIFLALTAIKPSKGWLNLQTSGNENFILYAEDIKNFKDLVFIAGIKKSFIGFETASLRILFTIIGVTVALLLGYGLHRLLSLRFAPLGELKLAVKEEEFIAYYQPIISLSTGKCIGAEALIRWNHPEQGIITPNNFIPLAEKTGLIIPMTISLMKNIRKDFSAFMKETGIYVSINLTAEHFTLDSTLKDIKKHLLHEGIAPEQILFELTERGLIEDTHHKTRKLMNDLHELGCKIAIDDFGTGYSSLSYLKHYSLDYLKIDKAFMDAVGTDAVTSHIADSIIDMAHKLNLKIIAEGVENEIQVNYLKAKDVACAQGYFFSKPLGLEDFKAFVRERNQ